jgi:hypothetical protein
LSQPFDKLLIMAISDRARKTLWTKAGGRCSLCRVLLVAVATDGDAPSVFGEEAHIVAQSPGGPRAAEIAEVDSYDNLILLCRIDHKRVDDQAGYFTVERLRAIKLAHEAWVQAQGEVLITALPQANVPAAPPTALSIALTVQMSDEALFMCALALVALALAALAYQARPA